MKAILLMLALGLAVMQNVEPPEFPAGHFCKKPEDVRPNDPRDHPCDCRAMDNCDKPEEGQGTGPSENPKCLQFATEITVPVSPTANEQLC